MNSIWRSAGALAKGFWRKTSVWRRSARLTAERAELPLSRKSIREMAAILDSKETRTPSRAIVRGPEVPFERELAERIRKETDVWNRNNVTRTQAYWNLYREFPELHWALLAHLVSRNGGWSMTDLKGEWLPYLLDEDKAADQFKLLETCNALIFRDAYPQLRVYAESRRAGAPLFGLLPSFGVSSFMSPFWERFWVTRESPLLTVALIVNEQHVIQAPVVENSFFRERVFDLSFRMLPFLQENQLLFPLLQPDSRRDRSLTLAGRVLEKFTNLDERIAFGKCLYGMLFAYPRVLTGAVYFAAKVPHTGSRADYWPERFTAASQQKSGGVSPSGENPAAKRWYSPPLLEAWPDQPLPQSELPDWFRDPKALHYVSKPKPPRILDMTAEHLFGQRKWQTAVRMAARIR
ncbi:DUF2515 family protein [Cohnella candidum]|uniref:DUF2515 family protein n=1 Tax=Cohnella candidum TaxID=2674991 RepID=UPI0013DE4632|nr:DUF2515 family protein [Cohnella candidum]